MQRQSSSRYFGGVISFSPSRYLNSNKTTKQVIANDHARGKCVSTDKQLQVSGSTLPPYSGPLVNRSLSKPIQNHANRSSCKVQKNPHPKLPKNKCSTDSQLDSLLVNRAQPADLLNKKQISPSKNALHSDSVHIIKQLLQSCKIQGIDKHQIQRLVNTFGLRIESMKYPSTQKPPAEPIRQPQESPSKIFLKRTRKKIHSFIRQQHAIQTQPSAPVDKLGKTLNKFSINNSQQIRQLNKPFKFGDAVNDNFRPRLRKYRQFLFMINFSNKIYRQLEFEDYPTPIRYYVGRGNNSELVRTMFRKRFWLVESNTMREAQIVWTQIKIQSIFDRQESALEQQSAQDKQLEELPILTHNSKKLLRKVDQQDPLLKLLTEQQYLVYNHNIDTLTKFRKQKYVSFHNRSRMLKLSTQQKKISMHNHLPNNGMLGNKKAMFYSLRQYYRLHNQDVFKTVPLTFHIQGIKDPQYKRFASAFTNKSKEGSMNIWIVKPGEFTNRGQGIVCLNKLSSIGQVIGGNKKQQRTYIVQQYITRPLLYNGRKFDIRVYMLITINNGSLKGYWYQQGYVRTSSYRFNLQLLKDSMVHLTNDAVQKHCEDYGKYQQGNKLSFSDLQRYCENYYKKDFYQSVYPILKKVATQSIQSTYLFLDPKKRQNNFEIFGLDFMIDQNFRPWLLEVNTNPCLQVGCPVLQRIIPPMLQNAFRISVDPQFPPPDNFPWSQKHFISEAPTLFNKFELVFDQSRDNRRLNSIYINSNLMQQIGKAPQDKEEYEDESIPSAEYVS